MQNAIKVKVCGASDMGRVRKNNEDNFVVCNLTTGEVSRTPPLPALTLGSFGSLFMVADGMGGEASGEVASHICTFTVPKRLHENLKSLEQVSDVNFVLLLRESIEYANQIIHQSAQSDPASSWDGNHGHGGCFLRTLSFVAQVGDSRAYLIRDNELTQLTRDQTFLNYLKEIGVEVPTDPEMDNRKSILTQAVGSSENVNVKVTCTEVRQGDSILLCSDGLYNMVPGTEILRVMMGNEPLANKCQSLIDQANANGGNDNITVVMAEFSGAGLPLAAADAPVEVREFRQEDFAGRT